MRTSNKNASNFVQEKAEFKANNLHAVLNNHFYIVYSYGWYPLYAYSFVEEKWFENRCKYSVSTSKQKTQCRPISDTVYLTHEQMKDLLQGKAVVA